MEKLQYNKVALQVDHSNGTARLIMTYAEVGSGSYKVLVFTEVPNDVEACRTSASLYDTVIFHCWQFGRKIQFLVRDDFSGNTAAEDNSKMKYFDTVSCVGGKLVNLQLLLKSGKSIYRKSLPQKRFQIVPIADRGKNVQGMSDMRNFRSLPTFFEDTRKKMDPNDTTLKQFFQDLTTLHGNLMLNKVVCSTERGKLIKIRNNLSEWDDDDGVLGKLISQLTFFIRYSENNLLNYLDFSLFVLESFLEDYKGTSFKSTSRNLRAAPFQNHTICQYKIDLCNAPGISKRGKAYCYYNSSCVHTWKHRFKCGLCKKSFMGIKPLTLHLSLHKDPKKHEIDFGGKAVHIKQCKISKALLVPIQHGIKRVIVSSI